MLRFRPERVLLVFGLSALLLSPCSARAGFLTAFTGNTQMSDYSNSDGIVNFAVYQNTTANWATALGLSPSTLSGGGAIDTAAQYVYFFQIVNTDPNANGIDPPLEVLKVASGQIPYGSAGFLSNTVFNDTSGSAVGPSGNRYLGSEGPPSSPEDKGDNSSETGSFLNSTTPFVSAASAYNPQQADVGGAGAGNFADFVWGPVAGSGEIPLGSFSSVVFLTSNMAPSFGEGDLRDGSPLSDGPIPVQGPEPASWVLSILGILGLAGRHGWRRVRPDGIA